MLPLIAIVIADALAAAIGLASSRPIKQVEPSRIHLLSIAVRANGMGDVFLVVAAWAPHFRSANPMLVRPALWAEG